MKKLKIGYFADGPWSHRAFELLNRNPSIEIAFIVPRTDTVDQKLLQYSKTHSIPYLKGVKINSKSFISLAETYCCDLFVSMSFNQIFKSSIINTPKLGTINCHAGMLPFYRGRNVLNWVLINDEKEFGITVHFIDEGVDTGDIILQRSFPIGDTDDYSTLLETAHEECAQLLYEAIELFQINKVNKISQTKFHSVGFYCGGRIEGDEMISWSQNSRQLFNFIRAICSPGPMAQTTINGQIVKINKAKLVEKAPNYINTVGQIVGKSANGYFVKSLDNVIEIFELTTDVKLKIGDRLGT
jgi:methionyl-tRNA formyltransferase